MLMVIMVTIPGTTTMDETITVAVVVIVGGAALLRMHYRLLS